MPPNSRIFNYYSKIRRKKQENIVYDLPLPLRADPDCRKTLRFPATCVRTTGQYGLFRGFPVDKPGIFAIIGLNETNVSLRCEVKSVKTRSSETYALIRTAIRDCREHRGTSPSVAELAAATGVSKATVSRYLSDMRERGELDYAGHRGIVMKGERQQTVRVPVLGAVACGLPKLAEENIEEYVSLPVSLFGSGEFYLLRASGESMIEAGIDDGDLVLIRQQDSADAGQIVVALVGDEATLKRFYSERGRVRLHPENSAMEDIYVENCLVQGVAVKVIKDLA